MTIHRFTVPRPAPDEAERQAKLDALTASLAPTDPALDALVSAARERFEVATVVISLVDRDRQVFRAKAGLDSAGSSRTVSFCGHAILEQAVFVVLDAASDPRFASNPFVEGDPFIRFYAGAPLVLGGGTGLGTFCILDPFPRATFSIADRDHLAAFASHAMEVMTSK